MKKLIKIIVWFTPAVSIFNGVGCYSMYERSIGVKPLAITICLAVLSIVWFWLATFSYTESLKKKK